MPTMDPQTSGQKASRPKGDGVELLSIVVIGVLMGCAVYLLLQKSLLRVVFGTVLITHGINLLLFTSGRIKRGGPPLIDREAATGHGDPSLLEAAGAAVTDPLPQALILTAIVIGFATTALVLVIAYRTYQTHGTDDLDRLRGADDGS